MLPDLSHHSTQGAALTQCLLEVLRVEAHAIAVHDQIAAGEGLTAARWSVLSEIRSSETGRTVSQIARTLGLQRQGIRKIVQTLVAKELLTLHDNPDHVKSPLVRITAKGQRVCERLASRQATWANRASLTQTASKLRQLHAQLRELTELLSNERRKLPARAA